MAKVIMVQGTMSGVGKSLLAAGLCRVMRQDGFRAAPFKSQNMALNSFVTEEGLEMGRAQVMQAEAAGMKPLVCMNPVLLKPVSHTGSQVIVNGRVLGNMSAREYFAYKRNLVPDIKRAFRKLADMADVVVIEGAGSPAEINLRDHDIVNMGLADMVDAPVILVGDIDRGGVFAQLLGTLMLLSEEERRRVKGLVINKFRGDMGLLDSGIRMLEEKGGIPVVGVIPYMDVSLEDEDSLSERFGGGERGILDMAVIRCPRISNFTDFNVFEQIPEVRVRYVESAEGLGRPDIIFLPGSKNTMEDLAWMRRRGLEAAVKKAAGEIPVWGICGGFQMLGQRISDPGGMEAGGVMEGMRLLGVETELGGQKVLRQVRGTVNGAEGIFAALSGLEYEGYEIHMGRSRMAERGAVGERQGMGESGADGRTGESEERVVLSDSGKMVYGTYVHGIFDKGDMAFALVKALADRKGISVGGGAEDFSVFKDRQYDKLADTLRQYMDMEEIYEILEEACVR